MYDSSKVNVIVAGFTVTGFSDSIIKRERITEDLYKSQLGLYGETLWCKQNDQRTKLTLSLHANSPANPKLYLFSLSPIALPVMVKNISDGKYLCGGVDGRVIKRPAVEFKKTVSDWIWIIQVNDFMEVFLPGGAIKL